MDKSRAPVITAIRDAKQESFVAALLGDSGWNLIFRATGSDALLSAIRSHPIALILASDDFGYDPSYSSNPFVILDSKKPLAEHELHEILRGVGESSSPASFAVAPSHSDVTLVATIDAGIGGSTVAINAAHESARSGKKTLLLDFNTANPSLSRYFDIQRIDRTISPTRFGFFVGEISQLSTFPEIAKDADTFEEVVIDLGKWPTSEYLMSGARIHEVLARWGIQSSSHIYLLARGDEDSIDRLHPIYSHSLLRALISKPVILLGSQSILSGREKRLMSERASLLSGAQVRHLPWERRAVMDAALARAPLGYQGQKSLLAQEISSLYRARGKRER